MAKKKTENVVKFHEPPVTSYPYVKNRVLVFDWASLSYHQMFSMKTDKNKKLLGILSSSDELLKWRNLMFGRVLRYIRLFNPKHVIFALEGKYAWRKDVVKDYYSEHARVYYDETSYYVVSDNTAYSVSLLGSEDGNEHYRVIPIELDNYSRFLDKKNRKLSEFPERVQDKLWNIYTDGGDPILPSYKGQRKSSVWPFSVSKKEWSESRETFAKDIAPLFRARAVQCDIAEGDDVIYAAVQKFAGISDDVILITHDSDMSQINNPKTRIFDHITDTFTNCEYPAEYLAAKILSGDSSDNIHGMAFVDKKTGMYKPTCKTRVASAGAIALMEACPNIYDVAKRNGWADQYMRNKTLIDLSMVPNHVSDNISRLLEKPEPEIGGDDIMENAGINVNFKQTYSQLKSFGFYAMTPLVTVENNPGIFNQELFAAAERGANPVLEGNAVKTIANESIAGVFNSPAFDIDMLF